MKSCFYDIRFLATYVTYTNTERLVTTSNGVCVSPMCICYDDNLSLVCNNLSVIHFLLFKG